VTARAGDLPPGGESGPARRGRANPRPPGPAGAPRIDGLYRVLYRWAYRAMRLYWAAVHPRTHGALVAIFHGRRILLVKNSYVPYHSLPGGYVKRRERSLDAARRELWEETGIRADPARLRLALDLDHRWEGKREHLEIFEMEVAEPPEVRIDRREVEWAEFVEVESALALPLFPPLRQVLEGRLGSGWGTAAPAGQSEVR